MADVAIASSRAVRFGEILRGRRLRSQEARWGYLFIAPNFVGFALFTAGPVVFSLILSLMKWDILSAPSFVGVENYVRLLTSDDLFPKVVRNTVYFTFVSVPLRMALALILALALNQPLRGTSWYRTVYFLPQVSMLVAVAIRRYQLHTQLVWCEASAVAHQRGLGHASSDPDECLEDCGHAHGHLPGRLTGHS